LEIGKEKGGSVRHEIVDCPLALPKLTQEREKPGVDSWIGTLHTKGGGKAAGCERQTLGTGPPNRAMRLARSPIRPFTKKGKKTEGRSWARTQKEGAMG